MSSACTPILVGMTSPVSEILLLSKTAKFPLLTMDYSPWSSKNLIDRIQPKKFMQVEIDDKCMHTNFGGCSLLSFGDIATFKNGQFSPSDHGLYWPWTIVGAHDALLLLSAFLPSCAPDYSPWSSKNLIERNRPKKFMHVGIDVKCMHTNFGGRG